VTARAFQEIIFTFAGDAAFAAIFAFVVVWFGPGFDRWRRAGHERRLAARLARGEDRYFEELRALRSDAPRAPFVARSFGWHFVRILALMCVLSAFVQLLKVLLSFLPE
jgi:glyoxylase-like metal-dependent hydrolase (beta-lactamase superfamily II)